MRGTQQTAAGAAGAPGPRPRGGVPRVSGRQAAEGLRGGGRGACSQLEMTRPRKAKRCASAWVFSSWHRVAHCHTSAPSAEPETTEAKPPLTVASPKPPGPLWSPNRTTPPPTCPPVTVALAVKWAAAAVRPRRWAALRACQRASVATVHWRWGAAKAGATGAGVGRVRLAHNHLAVRTGRRTAPGTQKAAGSALGWLHTIRVGNRREESRRHG